LIHFPMRIHEKLPDKAKNIIDFFYSLEVGHKQEQTWSQMTNSNAVEWYR
jgi:hypothetical protein